uniref:Uncharacterized protein n=1 Tax=Siphoviridae sp. ct4Am4 TaxID=2826287 RepID=A0A8S5R2D6_9CAUD|nr:MAG TPA: hypothetical protein [Siphoviridae sp. ct4Am4]
MALQRLDIARARQSGAWQRQCLVRLWRGVARQWQGSALRRSAEAKQPKTEY